ncbi:transmembrane protein, putative (DUF679 domain membrane protein 2) [Tasmannia lanceolata]|uniref:transmembrane protein, putative (DUF679 domain membrane protein 2) n=1 Tax=Tasmannia lanceolata TaxID=3420 RepID=UPI00406421F8
MQKKTQKEIKENTTQMAGESKKATSKTTQQSIGDKTFTGLGNLIRLLPTGTVFIFQFLSPLLTNNGECNTINKYLTGVLLLLSGFSCCFASFTDSYTGTDGRFHYAIVTKNGLWPFSDSESKSMDFSKYKLQFGDFVHSFFSLIVFGVVAILDTNTVSCYFPSMESSQKTLLMALPPSVGALSSFVFMVFPNKRHGIGYPTTQTTDES